MESNKYRSIPLLLDGTGLEVISASRLSSQPGKNQKKIWCEEHYQILFTMFEFEKKDIEVISRLLGFSTDMLSDIINLDPVYRTMLEKCWKPAYKCDNRNIVPSISDEFYEIRNVFGKAQKLCEQYKPAKKVYEKKGYKKSKKFRRLRVI